MKTTKIIFSIVLLSLAVTIIAQPSSRKERLAERQNNEPVYMYADYSSNENSRLENWMSDLSSWANGRASRKLSEAPVVVETYFIENADVVYEEMLDMEGWMTVPFESGPAEEALSLESWMSEPFEAAEYVEVEAWMTSPWI